MEALKNVKVGDKILITSRNEDEIKIVTKVTKTHIVCGTCKYKKSDGKLVGSDIWFSSYAKPATTEDIANVDRKKKTKRIANYISNIDFYNLPYEKLEKIYNILNDQEGNG